MPDAELAPHAGGTRGLVALVRGVSEALEHGSGGRVHISLERGRGRALEWAPPWARCVVKARGRPLRIGADILDAERSRGALTSASANLAGLLCTQVQSACAALATLCPGGTIVLAVRAGEADGTIDQLSRLGWTPRRVARTRLDASALAEPGAGDVVVLVATRRT